jgi:hypothetical protein
MPLMCGEYQGNRKQKEPWQRGRRGSLCGPVDEALAAQLLADSVLVDEKRFATHDGRA